MSDLARSSSSPSPAGSSPRRPSALRNTVGLLFGSFRRWANYRFQRRQMRETLKTLPIVILLTMLIWIWAEREQIVPPASIQEVDLRLSSSDRERIITIKDQPVIPKITIEIYGPKNGVEEVKRKLTRSVPPGIELELNNVKAATNQSISILDRVRDLPVFRANGVTVSNVRPSNLIIDVDRAVETEVEIKLPSDIPNIASVTFDPPKVKVRGPESLMKPKPEVFADLSESLASRGPGRHEFQGANLFVRPRDEHLSLSQSTAKAIIDVKQSNVEWTKNSMPIFVSGPPSVLQDFRVEFVRDTTLANVRLIGPPDVIAQLQNPNFTPQPRAVLDVDRGDVGEKKSKHLRFEDLPAGVTVSPDDQRREIEFRLVPRE